MVCLCVIIQTLLLILLTNPLVGITRLWWLVYIINFPKAHGSSLSGLPRAFSLNTISPPPSWFLTSLLVPHSPCWLFVFLVGFLHSLLVPSFVLLVVSFRLVGSLHSLLVVLFFLLLVALLLAGCLPLCASYLFSLLVSSFFLLVVLFLFVASLHSLLALLLFLHLVSLLLGGCLPLCASYLFFFFGFLVFLAECLTSPCWFPHSSCWLFCFSLSTSCFFRLAT